MFLNLAPKVSYKLEVIAFPTPTQNKLDLKLLTTIQQYNNMQ
jgi:hypothetical protein